VQYIALTTEGRRRFAAIAATHEGWIAELFSDLGEAQVERLLGLLNSAKRAVQARLDAGAPAPAAGRRAQQ
jgi:DNA-binding MarR family transcriptional regulator